MASEGARILVTGGGTGIGRAIADAFAGQGDAVFICGSSEEKLARILQKATHLNGMAADVSDPGQVDRLFEAVEHQFSGLDVLINNAGVSGPTGPIDETPVDEWQSVIGVNLSGPFYCARKAAAIMKSQGHGIILNISTTSVRVALPNRAPYVASKAGLHGLTRSLARELGPFNIRCNTISPGMVDNERGSRIREVRAEQQGVDPEQLLSYRLGFISMRTMVEPEDVGRLAVFLASDEARHISGQDISVCGNLEWE